MAQEVYRLPGGQVTQDAKKHYDTWMELIEPIEKAFGIYCVGFDPGITFASDLLYAESIRLPVWFAERLVEILRNSPLDKNAKG